jgi:putative ubiquitin-RnfH superfamily antitoxin RatB of RatAB toxin-antitoxin module
MADSSGTLAIEVCYPGTERHFLIPLAVPAGFTLHQAIEASGILQQAPEIDLSVWRVGVFGKLRPLDATLKQHDRIEIYRPLTADPMESRRRRAGKRAAME